MQHGTIMASDRICGFFGWPTVCRLPDGTLAAVSSGYRIRHICPFGKVVISYSRDEGKSWTNPMAIIDTPLDDRDAGIVTFGGKVMVTTFNNSRKMQSDSCEQHYSDDQKGNAFLKAYLDMVSDEDEERYLGSLYAISLDGGYKFEEPQKMPHNISSPHGPAVLSDGRLFYPGVSYNFTEPEKCEHKILYSFYKDGMWSLPNEITIPQEKNHKPLIFTECHSVQTHSGKIIVQMRVAGNYPDWSICDTYQCESIDGGMTFTMPVSIGIRGGAPSHLLQHSSGAVICTYGYRDKPYGQGAVVSFNDGVTWSSPVVLRDDAPNGDIGYASSVELKDGRILSIYYHRSNERRNPTIDYTIWSLDDVKI